MLTKTASYLIPMLLTMLPLVSAQPSTDQIFHSKLYYYYYYYPYYDQMMMMMMMIIDQNMDELWLLEIRRLFGMSVLRYY